MNIHQKFNSLEEYNSFMMELLGWVRDPYKSLWKEEDYPKLEPYFNWQRETKGLGQFPDEIKSSFDFYVKCHEEYGERNADIRDSVKGFDEWRLCDIFAFDLPDNDEDNEPVPVFIGEFVFPFIVTGAIECGFDRGGDCSFCCIRFVEAREFLRPS